jgi:hypothetical protein
MRGRHHLRLVIRRCEFIAARDRLGDLRDLDLGHATHVHTFDRRTGQFLNDLAFLRGLEHVPSDMKLNQWHYRSP